MIKHYLDTFFHSYYTLYLIRISILILFVIALLAIVVGIIIILLDQAYRANIPQYPFNIVLDRIIPIIALLCPTLFIIFLSPFDAWFTRFTLLLVIHIFILIPLLYYWSSLRRWSSKDESNSDIPLTYRSWNHPHLYLDIAIALIYPSLWGMYFSLSRYIRIGSTINLSSYISAFCNDYLEGIIIFIFIIPSTFLWLCLLIWRIMYIRKYLWTKVLSLIYSFDIIAISFETYFIIIEKLYKFHHLVFSLISLNGPVFFMNKNLPPFEIIKYPRWRYLLNFLFFKPFILKISIIIIPLFEIFFNNGNIHYTLYIIFAYPIISSFLTMFFSFGDHDWVLSCCYSDYILCNWNKPHYPGEFWNYFTDPLFWYNFSWTFSEEQQALLSKKQVKYESLIQRACGSSYNNHLRIKTYNRSFRIKVAVSFRREYGIRYMHTSRQLHPLTSIVVSKWQQAAVVLNDNFNHFNRLQKLTKERMIKPLIFPAQCDVYLPLPLSIYSTQPPKDLAVFHEENLTTYFNYNPNNVIARIWNKNLDGLVEYKFQKFPDNILDFSRTNFDFKGFIAVDQKTAKHPGLGRSELLSEINVNAYTSLLMRFEKELRKKGLITSEISYHLDMMINSINDFSLLQDHWFNCFVLL
jgi:hypothetical protein